MLRTSIICFVFASGCTTDPNATAQQPEPQTLSGTLTSSRQTPLPQPEVSVVWDIASMMSALAGAEHVDATGTFPNFSITVANPPPADMLDSLDGDVFGTALVVAAPAGTDFSTHTGWRGVDFDRIVVYLPEATTPGSTLEAFLHGAAPAGFHVYDVHRLTEDERQQRLACVNAIPHTGMLSEHDIYTRCGGAGRDELHRVDTEFAAPFQLDIVEDTGIVELINDLPRW